MCAPRLALGIALMLLAPNAALAVQVLSGPTLTMNPNGTTPLAGVVEFETDLPVGAELTIIDGNDVRTIDFPREVQVHYLPVLGLKPGQTYAVKVAILPGQMIGTLSATTGPLPADFPARIVHVSTPLAMEPGYTLLDCFSRGGDHRPGYTMILDAVGDVVWYTTQCWSGVLQRPNGELMARTNQTLTWMDMVGNLRSLHLQDPGLGLHHEIEPTPHGTYLSLTAHSVAVPAFPTSQTDPHAPLAPATLHDESVVEFLPDGSLRREWPLLELTDPQRIGYDSLNSTATGLDWVHTNAATYNASDDSIVVSSRHQDALYKFSRRTGQLIWILGNHANWSAAFQPYLLDPVGTPFRWQYHQHAPMWTAAGTLLVFDNGNYRASPFDGTTPVPEAQNFTRGVEFQIDENLMQVRQVWQYGENAPERLYSYFIGDADSLPVTGNRLLVLGGVSYVNGASSASLGLGPSHSRIIEVTDDAAPVKVFDVTLYDPTGGQINIYRGEKIPSLNPPQDVMAPNGVGNTLTLAKISGEPMLSWMVSPVDTAHSPADYYVVYESCSAAHSFAIFDSTANTHIGSGDRPDPMVFYMVVAANSAGTSRDEPTP